MAPSILWTTLSRRQAMDETGHVLAAHVSSSVAFARYDIGYTSRSKHDRYEAAHPDGYELIWLDPWADGYVEPPGFTAAIAAHIALGDAKKTNAESASEVGQ